jgi:hypothetical protein
MLSGKYKTSLVKKYACFGGKMISPNRQKSSKFEIFYKNYKNKFNCDALL